MLTLKYLEIFGRKLMRFTIFIKPIKTVNFKYIIGKLSIPLIYIALCEEKYENTKLDIIKKGIYAERIGKYETSEQLYHLALKLAVDSKDEKSVYHIYDLMANNALSAGAYEKAETLFKEVLRFIVSQDLNHKVYMTAFYEISIKLAKIFSLKGENDLAKISYEFCLSDIEAQLSQIIEPDKNDLSLLYAQCLHEYALFLIKDAKYVPAINYLNQSLQILKENSATNIHMDYSSKHNDRHKIFQLEEGQFNSALTTNNVTKNQKHLTDSNINPQLFIVMNDLAYAYEGINQFDKSLTLIDQALLGMNAMIQFYATLIDSELSYHQDINTSTNDSLAYERHRIQTFVGELKEKLCSFYINKANVLANQRNWISLHPEYNKVTNNHQIITTNDNNNNSNQQEFDPKHYCNSALVLAKAIKNAKLEMLAQQCMDDKKVINKMGKFA